MDKNEEFEVYEDPNYQIYSSNAEFRTALMLYGVVFSIIIFGIIPWAVGGISILKWLFF